MYCDRLHDQRILGSGGLSCEYAVENELRYHFLRDMAFRAKKAWPHVLVCDNSGFGKTEAGEINDFHYYPSEHWEAKKTLGKADGGLLSWIDL